MTARKLGADGFLQLSLQIAHNELHGWPCATYESASTCAYLNGRTETIRPCTLESRIDLIFHLGNLFCNHHSQIIDIRSPYPRTYYKTGVRFVNLDLGEIITWL